MIVSLRQSETSLLETIISVDLSCPKYQSASSCYVKTRNAYTQDSTRHGRDVMVVTLRYLTIHIAVDVTQCTVQALHLVTDIQNNRQTSMAVLNDDVMMTQCL